jgi:hypothetical protein
MSFFEEIPEPELEAREIHPRHAWQGPPAHMVGATVPIDLVLAGNGEVAVVLDRVRAYPTGVLIDITTLRRAVTDAEDALFGMRQRRSFRFGVELPDGFKIGDGAPGDTRRAMLNAQGGGGSELRYTTEYWLWPLPGEGTMRVACEWRELDLAESVHEVDTAPIRAAAARAVELWPP